jgi:hypothetical protein
MPTDWEHVARHRRLKDFAEKIGLEIREEGGCMTIYRDKVALFQDRNPKLILNWITTYGLCLPLPPHADWKEVMKESRSGLLGP